MIILKYIPTLLGISYMLNTVLSYFYINSPLLSSIAGISFLPWLFIFCSSIVFRFCSYHRVMLYYILIIELLNTYDYYIGIPLKDLELLMVHIVITGITLLTILVLYVRNYKRITTKDNK